MTVDRFVKAVSIYAATLGLLQGLAWFVLALIDILIYSEVWLPAVAESDPETNGQALSAQLAIYALFVKDDETDVWIGATELFVAAVLYLVSSVGWIILSSTIIWIFTTEQYSTLKKVLSGWGVCTIIICIIDLIMASCLARDYDYIVTAFNKESSFGYAILACGVLMSLAAKGYVLWIINLSCAITALIVSNEVPKKIVATDFNTNMIEAYGSTSPSRQGITNPGFTWDNDKTNFTRSNSFLTPPPQPNAAPQRYPTPPPKPNVNDRLARIGKQGGRSPPQNIPPPRTPQSYIYPSLPRIPSPDYSPPNSPYKPPLKPALKNRPPQNAFVFPSGKY